MLAGQTYINTARRGRNLAPVSYICICSSLLGPLEWLPNVKVSCGHFSFRRWGPEINQIFSFKKRDVREIPLLSFFCFFLVLFAPSRAITIHRIKESRNNYPQVDLALKSGVLRYEKWIGKCFFWHLNEEQGSNRREGRG